MLVVNLNSRILNEKPATTQTGAFWNGFDEYCKGALLEDMPSAEHKRGWWWANKCEGDTNDYEENIADRAFWARGTW